MRWRKSEWILWERRAVIRNKTEHLTFLSFYFFFEDCYRKRRRRPIYNLLYPSARAFFMYFQVSTFSLNYLFSEFDSSCKKTFALSPCLQPVGILVKGCKFSPFDVGFTQNSIFKGTVGVLVWSRWKQSFFVLFLSRSICLTVEV